MRIKFIRQYEDPHLPGRFYLPGWVAEFTDPDGQRAIEAGAAEPAPDGAFSRKGAAPSFECAVPNQPLSGTFKKTEEKTTLKGLIGKK